MIRIDNELYYLAEGTGEPTEARLALLRILQAIAAARPDGAATVSSRVLMRLLGLQRLEAFSRRLRNLIKDGYLIPREAQLKQLDRLMA